MFGFERQVSLIFRRDLPRLVVLLRVIVVREFAVDRDFGHFCMLYLFLESGVSMFVD